MVALPAYREGAGNLQSCIDNYTLSVALAANVPEFLSVPTDENGKLAKWVTFGAPVASDFFAAGFSSAEFADRVTTGNFNTIATNPLFGSDTAWTKGTGWTISGGAANATTATSALSQTATFIPGMTYTLTYTVTASAGTITPSIGGTAGTPRSTSATFSETIVAGSSNSLIAFTGAGFTGTVDAVFITAWTYGVGWTQNGTVATATGAISTDLSQTAANSVQLVAGQPYLVTYTTTSVSAGTITINIGGTAGTARSTSATFSEVIIAGTSQVITFTTSGFTGIVDNLSAFATATVAVDSTAGATSEQNPSGYFLNNDVSVISLASGGTPTITANFYK